MGDVVPGFLYPGNTMSNQNQQFDQLDVLQNVVLFTLAGIHLWTGRKRLHAEDLGAGTNLPPETLASLGSKKIIDPEKLRIFETLKRRAHSLCGESGTRFLSGYAVPRAKAPELAADLDLIKAEFSTKKSDFIATYESDVEDWLSRNSQWAHILRRSVTPKIDVERQLSFGWEACVVTPSADPVLNSTLNNAVGGLSEGLFSEVAAAARLTLEQSVIGRVSANRRLLSPLKRLRSKLDGLAFIDPMVQPIVMTIDHVLSEISPTGPIEGRDMEAVRSLFYLMADPNSMREHGRRLLSGQSVDQALGNDDLVTDDIAGDTEQHHAAPVATDEPVSAEETGLENTPVLAPVQETQSGSNQVDDEASDEEIVLTISEPASIASVSPRPSGLVVQAELPVVPSVPQAHIEQCRTVLKKHRPRLTPLGF